MALNLNLPWHRLSNVDLSRLHNSSGRCYFSLGIDSDGRAASDIAEALKRNDTLTELEFRNVKLGDVGCEFLAGALTFNTALRELRLIECAVTDKGCWYLAVALKRNATLTSLDITNNAFDSEGVGYIADALKSNNVLTTLSLGWNRFGDDGCWRLADGLLHNAALTTLQLHLCDLSGVGVRYLAMAWRADAVLATLDLRYNNISAEEVWHIASALKTNASLTCLVLSGNDIRDDGTFYLSEALKSNTRLVTLRLEQNSIGEDGAYYLAMAMNTNGTLTTLGLANNELKSGVRSLAKALHAHVLTDLDLSSTEVGQDPNDMWYLAEALKCNCCLTSLNLSGTLICAESAVYIADALMENRNLAKLLISNNLFDVGTGYFAELLEVNTNLKRLDIDCRPVWTTRFLEAMRGNYVLTELNLCDNYMTLDLDWDELQVEEDSRHASQQTIIAIERLLRKNKGGSCCFTVSYDERQVVELSSVAGNQVACFSMETSATVSDLWELADHKLGSPDYRMVLVLADGCKLNVFPDETSLLEVFINTGKGL